MRILLVTWTDQLLEKLSALNPQLEFCAIVVDEVEPAQEILANSGLPKSFVHPLYELKECVKNFHYDYIICLENGWCQTALADNVKKYGVAQEKILNFCALTMVHNFLLERSLRYFKEHAAEFDMFATGISYIEKGLDVTQFKKKLFNFGRGSQDLYYNFQVAKHAVSCGGGYSKIRHALIGLAPYSFHYDLSKSITTQSLMLQYLIAFGDLHNFHMPADEYRKLFRAEYLASRLPLEPFDLNDPYLISKTVPRFMTPGSRLSARRTIDGWAEKNYPETRNENIKILGDYLTLCEENNIRPIMFLPPMSEGHVKYFSRQKLDEFYYLVRAACRKHSSAIFIDGWKLQGVTDADFYDVNHMNIQGAAKFSAFLNNFIEGL